jgi:CHAT domain-containing protein
MKRVGIRIVAVVAGMALLLAVTSTAQAQGGRRGQGGGRGRGFPPPGQPSPAEKLAPGEYSLEFDQVLEAINRGEGHQALAYYERVAAQAEQQGDGLRAARADHAAASAALRVGLYQKAIRSGMRSIELFKAAGLSNLSPFDLGRLGSVYAQVGAAYRSIGDHAQARTVLEEGLAFSEGHLAGRRENVVTGFLSSTLASVAYAQRDYQTALARASQAAQFFEGALGRLPDRAPERRRLNLSRRAAQALVVVARAQLALGQRDEAEAALDRALRYARQLGSGTLEAEVLLYQGRLALSRQEWSKASSFYQRGITLASQAGQSALLILLNDNLSRALAELGRPEEALAAARESIQRVEEVRGELGDPDLRSEYLDNKQAIYQRAVRLALQAQRPDEAFELAERSRARAFLDLLGNETTLSKGRTRALVDEEVRLRAQLAEAQARVQEAAGSEESDASRAPVEAAEREYRAFLDRVRKENLEQASLMSVDPVTLPEIQRLLPDDTTLLEYLVGEDDTILWVVDRQHVKATRIPGGRQALVAQVRRFRGAIASQAPLANVQAQAQALYERLVEPARSEVRGDRLLIVPHGVLHYLPFSALRSPAGRWLIEDAGLDTLPSASVLRYLAQKGAGAPDRALVVGNPDVGAGLALRWAEREARMVGQQERGATVLLRADATEAQVKKLLETAGLVHFATHAEFSESDPLASALLLAPGDGDDGRLEVRELFGLDLRARLVVLSACETGLGKLSRGDELVGLQRAFIYAGTPTVVTTLWKVDDRASYELVRAFYERVERVGPVQALRQAQLETMRAFPHPFAWAAFGLTGIPR